MTLNEYIKSTDSNAFWRLSSGEHQNLLNEALEKIKKLENKLCEPAEDEHEPNEKQATIKFITRIGIERTADFIINQRKSIEALINNNNTFIEAYKKSQTNIISVD